MKSFLTIVLLVVSLCTATGQNLIGYKQDEIKRYMKENLKEMNLNRVNNDKFNYLKYSDISDSQTILFFLDKDSVCRSIRITCDENTKQQKIKEFNSVYEKKGENSWVDKRQGKSYMILMRDEDWASVITIVPVN